MTQELSLKQRQTMRWRALRVPVSSFFELTPRCTFDCKMCYIHLTPKQMGERRELSTEQWLQITDEAVDAGMFYVVLTGGECMLHPGFWEIYYHLLDRNVAVTINTNAFALTDEDLARFRERSPASFRVTLYAASEDGYERVTGCRAFAQVMNNLKKLREDFRVNLALTLIRQNMDEILEMTELAKTLRVPYGYVTELIQPEADTGRNLDGSALTLAEQIQKQVELAACNGRTLFQNEPIPELPPLLPDDPTCKGLTCGAGRTAYCIHWDGEMSCCLEVPGTVNVKDVGFRAGWEAAKQTSMEVLRPVECETCRLRRLCRTCAMARRDPANPGHCNRDICAETLARYNAGLISLNEGGDVGHTIPEDVQEDC